MLLHDVRGVPLLFLFGSLEGSDPVGGWKIQVVIEDMISDGREGAALLVNPEDTTEIAEAIYRALNSSCGADLRRRGIERSRAFSWEATATKTLAVYNEIM